MAVRQQKRKENALQTFAPLQEGLIQKWVRVHAPVRHFVVKNYFKIVISNAE